MQLKLNLAISYAVFLIKCNIYYIHYSMCIIFQSLQAACQNLHIAKTNPHNSWGEGTSSTGPRTGVYSRSTRSHHLLLPVEAVLDGQLNPSLAQDCVSHHVDPVAEGSDHHPDSLPVLPCNSPHDIGATEQVHITSSWAVQGSKITFGHSGQRIWIMRSLGA